MTQVRCCPKDLSSRLCCAMQPAQNPMQLQWVSDKSHQLTLPECMSALTTHSNIDPSTVSPSLQSFVRLALTNMWPVLQLKVRQALWNKARPAREVALSLLKRFEMCTFILDANAAQQLSVKARVASSGPKQSAPSDDALQWLRCQPAARASQCKTSVSGPSMPPSAPGNLAEPAALSPCSAGGSACVTAKKLPNLQADGRGTGTSALKTVSKNCSSSDADNATNESPRSAVHRRTKLAEQREAGNFDCSLCLSSLLDACMACCPCGHVYHHECLQTMLSIHPQCPMCERACKLNESIKLYL